MTNTEKFIQHYNEIDEFLRSHQKDGEYIPFSQLLRDSNNRVVRLNYSILKQFADLRNILSHSKEEIAEPTNEAVERFKQIEQAIINPPNALNKLAIRKNEIFTAKLRDNVLHVIEIMNKNIYTHAPVVNENEVLVGVFSEETLFSYLAEKKEVIIDQTVIIKEFEDFIPLKKHRSEYFEFVPKNSDVFQIELLFKNYIKDKKRLGMVFITENGKTEETILGIMTAWDLGKKDL